MSSIRIRWPHVADWASDHQGVVVRAIRHANQGRLWQPSLKTGHLAERPSEGHMVWIPPLYHHPKLRGTLPWHVSIHLDFTMKSYPGVDHEITVRYTLTEAKGARSPVSSITSTASSMRILQGTLERCSQTNSRSDAPQYVQEQYTASQWTMHLESTMPRLPTLDTISRSISSQRSLQRIGILPKMHSKSLDFVEESK